MEMRDLTSLNSINEREFLDLINKEINEALDKDKKVIEMEQSLQILCANTNKLLLCFQMKFIYGSSLEQDSLLTVTDIATMYKKTNQTILDWIKNKGLPSHQIIDDYYVLKKDLEDWSKNKAWNIPQAQKVLKTRKGFLKVAA